MAFPAGGWYPQFSPDGERIAAGAVSVTVADVVLQGDGVTLLPNNQHDLGVGQAPVWYGPSTVLFYNRGDGPAARLRVSSSPFTTVTDLASLPATYLSAGGGHYIVAQNGQQRILVDGAVVASQGGAVWMDSNGRYVYTQSQNQALYLSGVGRLDFHTSGLADPFVTPVAAAWTRLGGQRQTTGYRDSDGSIVNLGLGLTDEFYPRVIDTPVGPWIAYHSHTQLLLHPWGNATLVVVHTGVTNFPHAVYHGATGSFRLAWSAAGQLVMRAVPLNILDPIYAPGLGTVIGSVGGGPTFGGPSDTQITPTQKLAETAKLQAARRPRPVFPHVDQVGDQNAQSALRILFDRVFQVEQQIQGESGVARQLLTLQQQQAADRTALETQMTQLSVAATGTTPAVGGAFPSPTPPNGGGGGTPPPGGGGGGSSGCAGAPATGHIAAGELTFTRFAQIVCGTATEWSQYLVATSTLAQREGNAETLIERMIWHLAQGGFTAGRQRNPSTAISKDKLACVILTETRAFDIFRDFDNYTATLRVGPVEVFPADLVASAGISD